MGGTLGGILGIFFVALRRALGEHAGGGGPPQQLWARAVRDALASLGRYTPAKVGDRTVMDTLIPFAEALEAGASFADAVEAAERGAESTRNLKAKLGRATYVAGAEDASKGLPPDPGAWGAMVAIKGLYSAM
ncbi:dhal domain-containing protein [Xylariomycetidae sp. FL0641]|nr:dhal domain-containing protein [Xylariomycetidae sp. FL0641]